METSWRWTDSMPAVHSAESKLASVRSSRRTRSAWIWVEPSLIAPTAVICVRLRAGPTCAKDG